MKIIKKIASYLAIAALAIVSALNYAIFVFPNSFAPAGIDGICTMIQDVSGINIGYLAMVVNIPLIILAFFYLNRDFAIKSTIYIIVFSFASILIKTLDLSLLYYHTDTGSSVVLAPIAAGVIRGILYAITLNLNGSSGGIDFIAAVIKKKNPYLDLMNVIFAINLLVAISSYFVYGMRIEPVICSILYSFITSSVSSHIRSGKRQAVKFEIITSDAAKICREISEKLGQTSTVVDAKGAYSGADKKMVVCVTDKHKAPYLEELILTLPTVVVFKSTVDNTVSGIDYK